MAINTVHTVPPNQSALCRQTRSETKSSVTPTTPSSRDVELVSQESPGPATSPGYTPERRSLQSPLDDAASPNPIRDDARRV